MAQLRYSSVWKPLRRQMNARLRTRCLGIVAWDGVHSCWNGQAMEVRWAQLLTYDSLDEARTSCIYEMGRRG